MGSRSTGTPFTAGANSKSGGSSSAVPSLPGRGSRSTGNPLNPSERNSKSSGGSTAPIDGSIRRGYVQESQSDLGPTQSGNARPGGGSRVMKLSPPDGSPR